MREFSKIRAFRWKEPRPRRIEQQFIPTQSLRDQTVELNHDLAAEGNVEVRAVAKSRITAAERKAIDDYLEKNPVRRFGDSESADDLHIMSFLNRQGYEVHRKIFPTDGGRIEYVIRNRWETEQRRMSRQAFLDFVNAIRAKFQMPAIGQLA